MNTHPAIQKKRHLFAIIALLCTPISGLSIDIYVPSLPAVMEHFQVSSSLVQLSITTYLMGFGLMQLIAGTLTDCFGRKKPFILSALLYTISSALIPFSTSIYFLLIMRFLQGIAVAGANVSNRTIISDLYTGKEFLKMMNYMTLVWAIGPIVAPAIGGYLQHYYGWQAPFYFLTVFGFGMLLLNGLIVPETIVQHQAFKLKPIMANFREILSNPLFISGLFSLGLIYSILILFSIIAPFLIQTKLNYSPISFGHMALVMGLFWFVGNMLNRVFIEVSFKYQMIVSLMVMLLAAFSMVLGALTYPLNLYVILIPSFILALVGGSIFPNAFSRCVLLFPKTPATANALLGAFLILIASFSSAFGSLLKANTEMPLALTYLAICIVLMMLYLLMQILKPNGNA